MTRCRLCQSDQLDPLPFAVPADRGTWFRCGACGSDTNTESYDPKQYANNAEYAAGYATNGLPALRDDCRTNCEWFFDFALVKHGRDFLDIGCGPGAALDVMAELGWNPHGFDVAPVESKYPTVIRPLFHRWWWPKRFAAVLAREVFEHLPNPEMFLHEAHGVTLPGGLFQLQTPVPLAYPYEHAYGRGHLFLASPKRVKELLAEAMFDVLGERHWDVGQVYLCRARG